MSVKVLPKIEVQGCVCKLTLAQLSLRDPLPDDAAGIVDHSGRLELHGFHHIAHTNLQRQGYHDCRFAAPPTSHLFTGTASVSQRCARSRVKQRSSYSDSFPTILTDDYQPEHNMLTLGRDADKGCT